MLGCLTHRINYMHTRPALILALLAACAAPHGTAAREKATSLARLGNHSLRVTTTSKAAQEAFDRGLTLAYSFGHHAAEQEFQRAAAADPYCPMAWWGIALVNGPHINFPMMPPENAAKAWEALSKAKALAPRATPFEQELIEALSKRYANPAPDDRAPLDGAYAEAMRTLWHGYPHSPDAGSLFAQAVMDVHPWDLWKGGEAQPWTPEIVET